MQTQAECLVQKTITEPPVCVLAQITRASHLQHRSDLYEHRCSSPASACCCTADLRLGPEVVLSMVEGNVTSGRQLHLVVQRCSVRAFPTRRAPHSPIHLLPLLPPLPLIHPIGISPLTIGKKKKKERRYFVISSVSRLLLKAEKLLH